MRRLSVFLVICLKLLADPVEDFMPSSPDEIALLHNPIVDAEYVHPLSGQLSLRERDLQALGSDQSLQLVRIYKPPKIMGKYAHKNRYDQFDLAESLSHTENGWVILPHLWCGYNRFSPNLQIKDPSGFVLEFKIAGNRGYLVTPNFGMSNLLGDEPSGEADLRNTELLIERDGLRLITPGGIQRVYQKISSLIYRLEREILPNGKSIYYQYVGKDLFRMSSLDGSLWIEKRGNAYMGSDQRGVCYDFEERVIHGKKHKLEHIAPILLLNKSTGPFYTHSMEYNERVLLTSYDFKNHPISCSYTKQKGAPARVETLSTPSGSYHYSYDSPVAGQKGGTTTLTLPNGAQKIYRYDSNLLLTAIENWHGSLVNKKQFFYDAKQHLSRVELRDEKGILSFAKSYECDKWGNPLRETWEGDFGQFAIQREFSKNRLLKEERDDGLGVEYTYLGDTRLLLTKTTFDHGKQIRKISYKYDEHYNLTEEMVHDRTITSYALYKSGPDLKRIEWKEVKDWSEQLIEKRRFAYDSWGNVSKEEIYGSDEKLCYVLEKSYNSKGDLISETNPIGQIASYQYDARGRSILEVPFSQNLNIQKSWDGKGRLTLLKEGERETTFIYNTSDQLVQKRDYLGLTTNYTHHPVHGKPTEISDPQTKTRFVYNAFGKVLEKEDAYGFKTRTQYNSYGSPVKVTYPSGGEESFAYASNGSLIEQIDPDGVKTSYQRDALGRIVSQTVGNYQTTYRYDGYDLLEVIDPKGISTCYQYDSIGKKIAEERSGRKTRFQYDALGFLSREEKGGRSIEYIRDPLGRLLQRSEGNIVKTLWTYDSSGNIATLKQEGTTRFAYDTYNRLVEKTDPANAKTRISYEEGDQLLIKRIQDPRGIETVETYDAHGLLLKREIPNCLLEEFEYDRNLRLSKQDHLTFTYTPEGILESMREGNLRTTTWQITAGGKIRSKQRPDGSTLPYDYNSQGQLIQMANREFQWDELGRLVKGSGFSRVLDPFGNVLKEEFANGLWIESTYDDWDRVLTRTLPDQSQIVYEYEGELLKKIVRRSPYGSILYTHSYDQYNKVGMPLLETGLFQTSYSYDQTGVRRTDQQSPYLKEQTVYDPVGNLIERGTVQYTYDDASRLTSESNRFTALYDIHHNCIEKNGEGIPIDTLNQLQNVAYDANGNLCKPNFVYDVHDQLIEAAGAIATYDALGRRLTKGNTAYLYIGQEEIGAFEQGSAKEIKIPGLKNAIAIEIKGNLYAPIYDLQGTIRLLINPNKRAIVAKNNCDALGCGLDDAIPYAYAGKRYDQDTGLVYFGKRFYDPTLSRWLTPDRLGCLNHSNLYQYYSDPTGESFCPNSPNRGGTGINEPSKLLLLYGL